MEVSSADRNRSVSAARSTRHFLDQLHAFDGERALVAQRIQ